MTEVAYRNGFRNAMRIAGRFFSFETNTETITDESGIDITDENGNNITEKV